MPGPSGVRSRRDSVSSRASHSEAGSVSGRKRSGEPGLVLVHEFGSKQFRDACQRAADSELMDQTTEDLSVIIGGQIDLMEQ